MKDMKALAGTSVALSLACGCTAGAVRPVAIGVPRR
jgi:hypothetical protein